MDNFINTILIAAVCCLPLLAVAFAVGFIVYRNRQRREGLETVAAALGMEKVAQVKQMWWYQRPLADGRRLAMIPVIIPGKRTNISGEYGKGIRRYDGALCMVLELHGDAFADVEVVRHEIWSAQERSLDSFETAFDTQNAAILSVAAQQALLDFARRHPGALWLHHRARTPLQILQTDAVLAGAGMILLHEYRTPAAETEIVRAKTADLLEVARVIESESK